MRLAATGVGELRELVELYNRMGDTLRSERSEIYQRELLLDTLLQGAPMAILLVNELDRIVYANSAATAPGRAPRRLPGREPGKYSRLRPGADAAGARRRARTPSSPWTPTDPGSQEETYRVVQRQVSSQHADAEAHRRRADHAGASTPGGRGLEESDPGHEPRAEQLGRPDQLALPLGAGRGAGGRSRRTGSMTSSARSRSASGTCGTFSTVTRASRSSLRPARSRSTGKASSRRCAPSTPSRWSGTPPSHRLLRSGPDPAGAHQPAQECGGVGKRAGGRVGVARDLSGRRGRPARPRPGKGHGRRDDAERPRPFYSSKRDGSGLGLPLCTEILSAHGGTLALERRPGGGTVVTCTIPAPPEVRQGGAVKG